jgi:hypothetical protein
MGGGESKYFKREIPLETLRGPSAQRKGGDGETQRRRDTEESKIN